MTTKLIASVKDVNGVATIVYFCKERKRIYENKFAKLVREFKEEKRRNKRK